MITVVWKERQNKHQLKLVNREEMLPVFVVPSLFGLASLVASPCSPPAVNMQNSGDSWDYPVEMSIAESAIFTVLVTNDCDDKDLTYTWTGREESRPTMRQLGSTTVPKRVIQSFLAPLERAIICVRVALTSDSTIYTDACGYFRFVIPTPSAILQGLEFETAELSQTQTLDGTQSNDPMDTNIMAASNYHVPDPLTYDWYCSLDDEKPTPKNYQNGSRK
ncbi:uncharacterized protein LOC142354121 [Convolutriloba macropyga]|uniref:uncharacterized protein LOC142354121 n=1 Tax=Convolutriloba macropyga TaxID=536237 RepID=UPI003F523F94